MGLPFGSFTGEGYGIGRFGASRPRQCFEWCSGLDPTVILRISPGDPSRLINATGDQSFEESESETGGDREMRRRAIKKGSVGYPLSSLAEG